MNPNNRKNIRSKRSRRIDVSSLPQGDNPWRNNERPNEDRRDHVERHQDFREGREYAMDSENHSRITSENMHGHGDDHISRDHGHELHRDHHELPRETQPQRHQQNHYRSVDPPRNPRIHPDASASMYNASRNPPHSSHKQYSTFDQRRDSDPRSGNHPGSSEEYPDQRGMDAAGDASHQHPRYDNLEFYRSGMAPSYEWSSNYFSLNRPAHNMDYNSLLPGSASIPSYNPNYLKDNEYAPLNYVTTSPYYQSDLYVHSGNTPERVPGTSSKQIHRPPKVVRSSSLEWRVLRFQCMKITLNGLLCLAICGLIVLCILMVRDDISFTAWSISSGGCIICLMIGLLSGCLVYLHEKMVIEDDF